MSEIISSNNSYYTFTGVGYATMVIRFLSYNKIIPFSFH